MKTINFAKDFTRFPAGRYRKHGDCTGQVFREDHLVPALRGNERVIVDFTDVFGVPSSFAEEAFGGLIREEGLCLNDIKNKLILTGCKEQGRIWELMEDAHGRF